MTTIFSNNGDIDSEVMRGLFKDLPGNRVMELTAPMKDDDVDWRRMVADAVAAKDDTLVLCGHGSPCGMYFPGFTDYAIDNLHAPTIRAKRLVCSWCYASDFAMSYGLRNCLATGMFISNVAEAEDNGIYGRTQAEIVSTCRAIDSEVNALLRSDVPMDEWVMRIGAHMDVENDVDVFNRQGIMYFS